MQPDASMRMNLVKNNTCQAACAQVLNMSKKKAFNKSVLGR